MTRSLTGRTDRGQPCASRTPRRTRIRAGFSLLELIAVVTILGIIAAVVIPRITSSSTTAAMKADQQTAAELRSAIERHYFDAGAFPADYNELVTDNYLHAAPSWQYYTNASGSKSQAYNNSTGKITLTD
ncbi:MAG: prepilin-type N-terminal cleavage/methylation domain-containing protein [Planctomycetota bacterium]